MCFEYDGTVVDMQPHVLSPGSHLVIDTIHQTQDAANVL